MRSGHTQDKNKGNFRCFPLKKLSTVDCKLAIVVPVIDLKRLENLFHHFCCVRHLMPFSFVGVGAVFTSQGGGKPNKKPLFLRTI